MPDDSLKKLADEEYTLFVLRQSHGVPLPHHTTGYLAYLAALKAQGPEGPLGGAPMFSMPTDPFSTFYRYLEDIENGTFIPPKPPAFVGPPAPFVPLKYEPRSYSYQYDGDLNRFLRFYNYGNLNISLEPIPLPARGPAIDVSPIPANVAALPGAGQVLQLTDAIAQFAPPSSSTTTLDPQQTNRPPVTLAPSLQAA